MMERDDQSDTDATSSAIELRHVGAKYELDGLRIDGKSYKVSQ